MAKKPVVTFTRADAPYPQKVEGSPAVRLRLPIPLTLRPGAAVKLDLGIRCSAPIVVGSSKIQVTKSFFIAGEPIVLEGTANVPEPVLMDALEPIAVGVPLLVQDFDLE